MMEKFHALESRYSGERLRALEAQRLAHEIAFAPVIFQVARLMEKFGVFGLLADVKEGLTAQEVAQRTGLTLYAAKVLLEASLTMGTVLYGGGGGEGGGGERRFVLSKTGWMLHADPLVSVNMRFMHEVNYRGMYYMEEALRKGTPEGLKVFGRWKSVYEGLAALPEPAKSSWLAFDHFYSDRSFDEALEVVFAYRPARLLDVGGNTGRWALRCTDYDRRVRVTVMDLPQQIEMMRRQVAGKRGQERISGYAADLLDERLPFPQGFDAIWMSQFLDCFSEEEIVAIVRRAAGAMDADSRLFVMETLWDRQRNEIAAFCLTQISLYFTVMANGRSRMYHSDDLIRCIDAGGLKVERICDGLGEGHSILVCRKK